MINVSLVSPAAGEAPVSAGAQPANAGAGGRGVFAALVDAGLNAAASGSGQGLPVSQPMAIPAVGKAVETPGEAAPSAEGLMSSLLQFMAVQQPPAAATPMTPTAPVAAGSTVTPMASPFPAATGEAQTASVETPMSTGSNLAKTAGPAERPNGIHLAAQTEAEPATVAPMPTRPLPVSGNGQTMPSATATRPADATPAMAGAQRERNAADPSEPMRPVTPPVATASDAQATAQASAPAASMPQNTPSETMTASPAEQPVLPSRDEAVGPGSPGIQTMSVATVLPVARTITEAQSATAGLGPDAEAMTVPRRPAAAKEAQAAPAASDPRVASDQTIPATGAANPAASSAEAGSVPAGGAAAADQPVEQPSAPAARFSSLLELVADTAPATKDGFVSPPSASSASLASSASASTAQPTASAHTPTTGPVPLSHLAVHIASHAQAGHQRFDIRLDPEELGRVDIRLEIKADGSTLTHLAVEKPETLDLLRNDQRQLERALQQAGLDARDGSLSFSLRDDQRGRPWQHSPYETQPNTGRANAGEAIEDSAAPLARTTRIGLTGIDISI